MLSAIAALAIALKRFITLAITPIAALAVNAPAARAAGHEHRGFSLRHLLAEGDQGEQTDVYAEDVGDVAYYARCFRNVDFPLRVSDMANYTGAAVDYRPVRPA